jgi:hypothetical protein
VLSLARFNLYANSYTYLLGPKPKHDNFWRFELGGVAFFWLYFGLMLENLPNWKMRIAYLLVSHIVTSPVHIQVSCLPHSYLELMADAAVRSHCHISLARRKIWVQRNPSPRVNCGRRWM